VYEIAQLLTSKTVRVHLPGATKEEVLNHLLGLVKNDPRIGDFEQVREAVLAREVMMSTGVGKGLALPHGRTPAVTEIVAAFATSAQPVPFDAVDGAPARLYFLLVGPENARSEHIKTMSRVSRLMNEATFREQLLAAESAEAIIALFEESERNLG
jgi:mannitol/fructose-specific phosphotransferase system IIA component (Ntr-type)